MSGLPLYVRVRNEIRKEIEHGATKLGSDGALGNQQHLASRYNVSVGTVKRALGELERQGLIVSRQGKGVLLTGGVRDSEVDRGKKLMPEVGIAFFDISGRMSSPYFRRIMDGVEAFSEEHHIALHVISLPGIEMELQEDAFLSSFSFMNLDGMLLLSPVSSSFVTRISRKGIPYVSVNIFADRPEVARFCDVVSMEYKVVDAVLRRGKKKVLFYGGKEAKFTTYLLCVGHKLALDKHGLEVDPEYIVYEDYDSDNAVRILESMLDKKMEIDAVVAFDDMMGAVIHDFLVSKGREDILVAGFGNYNGFEEKVKITTDGRLFELGYGSIETLYDMINGINPERTKVNYDSILIERD